VARWAGSEGLVSPNIATEEEIMHSRWIIGATLALFVAAPVILEAQTSTDSGSKTDRAVEKTKDAAGKATGATKDSWITAKAKIALFADDRVAGRNVRIDTQNGVLSLRGKVGSADEKRVVEEAVRNIDGVTSVKNELQVVPESERKAVNAEDKDLKNAVEKRMKQETRLKGSDIDVRVDRGVGTLTGEVKDVGARARASEVASAVPGVRSVKNELREKSS
jgi:hyperosmotically inducible periplasmic protein